MYNNHMEMGGVEFMLPELMFTMSVRAQIPDCFPKQR